MKKFLQVLTISGVLMLTTVAANAQNVGIGTAAPAQKLEIAGTTNTIRINGLLAGGTYNPLTTVANTNSNIMYVNNATGDVYALPTGSVGSILAISATGIPTWTSASAATNAWNVTGGNATAAFTFNATPTTYLGTNASGGAGFQFAVVGNNAGQIVSTNFGNTAIGYQASNVASATSANVAIGYTALKSNTGTFNTGVGYAAMAQSSTGNDNVAVGYDALLNDVGGGNNTAVGASTLDASLTGSNNTAVGRFALSAVSSGAGNTGLGYEAGQATTTGANNTAVGFVAAFTNTSGTDVVAIGDSALYTNSTTSGNVAVGASALTKATTGSNSVAVGQNALQHNTTAFGNSAIGYNALDANTTGGNNTAVGINALSSGSGSGNTAVGANALKVNAVTYALGPNTAVGDSALANNTTGVKNVAIGFDAMMSNNNNNGNQNVAVGYGTLSSETGQIQDVAVGLFALASNNAGSNTGYNTAIGSQALRTGVSEIQDVAVGANAGGVMTGSNNVALGYDAADNTFSGGSNVVIGNAAATGVVSGSSNVIIGASAGTSLTSGGSNTAIGASSQIGAALTNATAIGANASATISNSLVLGSTAVAGGSSSAITTGLYLPGYSVPNTLLFTSAASGLVSYVAAGTNGQVLTANPSGVPTWTTPTSVSATAWTLTGNAVGYTFNAAPATYLGTTAGNGAGFQFGVQGVNAGSVEFTNGNTALGYQSLNANIGTFNVAMGYQAGSSISTGQDNVSIGTQSYITTGTETGADNIALGYQALNTTVYTSSANTASDNIAIGDQSMTSITTGGDQIGIGNSAGAAITTGTGNTSIGYVTMYDVAGNSSNNTVLGYLALLGGGSSSATNDNTAIGANALQNGVSSDNVAIGFNSMEENFTTTVGFNVAVGSGTLELGNSVSNSVAIGYNALYASTSSNNTAVGYLAYSHTPMSGTSNVGMGYQAMLSNSSGSNNTAIGYQAGYTATPANANTTGANNTFIGYNSGPGTATQLTNATALGNGALSPVSNSVTLGNAAAASLYLPGYTSVGSLLYTSAASGLISSTAAGTNGQILTLVTGVPTWAAAPVGTIVSGVAPIIITGTSSAPVVNIQGTTANQGGLLYSTGTGNAAAFGAQGTSGQVLVSGGAGAPTWANGNSLIPGTITQTVYFSAANTLTATSSMTNDGNGDVAITQTGGSSATPPPSLTVTAGVSTGSTSIGPDVYFNLARTVTINNFTPANVRAVYITAPNYTESLPNPPIGIASTVDIAGAPTHSGFEGITNAYALNVESGSVAIGSVASGGTNNVVASISNPGVVVYASTNGKLNSLPIVDNAILVTGATGLPSWSTTVTAPGDWQLTGNGVAYTYNAAPTTYLGTTAAGGAGFQFGVGGVNAGRVESTSAGTALGYQALNANTATGSTAVGYQAMESNTSGTQNTAVGYQALATNSTVSYNTAIGYQALKTLSGGAGYNTAVGGLALSNETGGNGNQDVAIGYQALLNNTTGQVNVAVGTDALIANQTNNNNTAVGYAALFGIGGNDNTALGFDAMLGAAGTGSGAITGTGAQNTAIGSGALQLIVGGGNNTAAGYRAMYSNTSGGSNSAFGWEALTNNTTGTENIGIGLNALLANNTNAGNVMVGDYAGRYTTGGSGSIGSGGMTGLVAGGNTGLGRSALYNNSTGGYNTAVGYFAMGGNFSANPNTTGNYNTALGFASLDLASGGGAASNTSIGSWALLNNTVSQNTAVGDSALVANTSGTDNTALGYQAASANTTGSYNTSLGYQSNFNPLAVSYSTALGSYAQSTASNQIVLGSNGAAPGSGSTITAQVAVNGALSPWNGTIYNSGSTGNILLSAGAAANDTWLANGTTGQVLTISGGVPTWGTPTTTGTAWQLLGNAGTVAGTNFIGTTDPVDLVFKTAGNEDMRIANSTGFVGIGTSAGNPPTQPLYVTHVDVANTYAISSNAIQTNISGDYQNVAMYGFAQAGNNTHGYEVGVMGVIHPVAHGGAALYGAINASVPTYAQTNNFYGIYTDANAVVSGGQTAYAAAFMNGNVGVGTATPAQSLEVASTTGTIRVDGMITGNSFNTAATSNSNLVFANNSTGDLYALPSGPNGAILALSATGVPTWSTSAVTATAWSLTGNAGTTPGTNFVGTTDAAALMFKAQDSIAGILDLTNRNVYFGTNAGDFGSAAANSVVIGYNAGAVNVTSGNEFIGYKAGQHNTEGGGNEFVGYKAGQSHVGGGAFGSGNLFMGYEAGLTDTSGEQNTFIGYFAGELNIGTGNTASYNTAVGGGAMFEAPGGADNTTIGFSSLVENTGNNNTAAGMYALNSNLSGSNNTSSGYGSLVSNSTGNNNTAVGYLAYSGWFLPSFSTGSNNTAMGASSLINNATGSSNVAIGANALYNSTTSLEVAVGDSALVNSTSGVNNTAVGYQALQTSTTGNNNTAVGYQADVNGAGFSNATAIGYLAKAAASNSVTLGSSSATALYVPGYSTAGGLLYTSAASGLVGSTTAGTSGQVLTSSGGGAPTWATPITSGSAWQLSGNAGTTPGVGVGQNYIGTTDSKDFVVATASTERLRVLSTGNVGISTPAPNSTLDVNGSMSVKVAVAVGPTTYNAGSNDYVIEGNCSGGAVTVQLPDATTVPGRLYYIASTNVNSSLSYIVTVQTTGTQVIGAYGTSITLINNYEQEYIVSDGSNWLIIGGSKM